MPAPNRSGCEYVKQAAQVLSQARLAESKVGSASLAGIPLTNLLTSVLWWLFHSRNPVRQPPHLLDPTQCNSSQWSPALQHRRITQPATEHSSLYIFRIRNFEKSLSSVRKALSFIFIAEISYMSWNISTPFWFCLQAQSFQCSRRHLLLTTVRSDGSNWCSEMNQFLVSPFDQGYMGCIHSYKDHHNKKSLSFLWHFMFLSRCIHSLA